MWIKQCFTVCLKHLGVPLNNSFLCLTWVATVCLEFLLKFHKYELILFVCFKYLNYSLEKSRINFLDHGIATGTDFWRIFKSHNCWYQVREDFLVHLPQDILIRWIQHPTKLFWFLHCRIWSMMRCISFLIVLSEKLDKTKQPLKRCRQWKCFAFITSGQKLLQFYYYFHVKIHISGVRIF